MIFGSELKQNAKEQLRGRWGLAIFVTLCANILTGLVSVSSDSYEISTKMLIIEGIIVIIGIVIAGAITVGFSKFILQCLDSEDFQRSAPPDGRSGGTCPPRLRRRSPGMAGWNQPDSYR